MLILRSFYTSLLQAVSPDARDVERLRGLTETNRVGLGVERDSQFAMYDNEDSGRNLKGKKSPPAAIVVQAVPVVKAAKSTKAPSIKSTKAPSVKSTKAPSVKSTKAPGSGKGKGVVVRTRKVLQDGENLQGPFTW